MEEKAENTRKPAMRLRSATSMTGEVGKIPPQAVDIEQVVLGALMLDKNAVAETLDVLLPVYFYDPRHQYIYTAIRVLDSSSQPVDILTVRNQLKKEGTLDSAGGASYISQLTSRIGSTAHVEYHARVILEKYIKREMIRMCGEVMSMSYDETNDVFDVMNHAEKTLFEITQNNARKEISEMRNVIHQAIEEIEEATKNKSGISGVPTGFIKLDAVTSGWQRSDMIVIAARPAMGKTAFVLSMARNTAVDYGHGVAIFSLEMSAVQLVKRLISSESQISAELLRKGQLEDHEMQQLHSKISKLSQAPIYIDDTAGISIFDLRAKCRRLKKKYDIQMVIIDYLQLMTAGGSNKGTGNREQEISTISRSIKEIAKELNIPIIALSQLSRSVEQRGGDKRPQLSDLRESGAIEQDADIVSFIYRPEYYEIYHDEDGNSNARVGEIIIAKHRNGATENVRLKFTREFARFDNFESESFESPLDISNTFSPESSFDSQRSDTITIPSKLNSSPVNSDDDNFSSNGVSETPF